MSSPLALEAAIAALRLGRPVRIDGAEPAAVLSVETGTRATLAALDPNGSAPLLLSGHRAAALSLGNARDAADPAHPVLIRRPPWLGACTAAALADPGQDLARAPVGPLEPMPLPGDAMPAAALSLARMAGLLPALWLLEPGGDEPSVHIDSIAGAHGAVAAVAARARLPLEGLPDTQIVAFRSSDGHEHAALLIGSFGGEPPLVRLHSECLTGDVFGSLKCDCGPQLQAALRTIAGEGGGILLYLRQEGRGIGLANKIRAYALQDRGLDTVDANERLGFSDDERDYDTAAAMLRALGASRVRLLTNNPSKVTALELAGIEVAERIAHHMPANPHNADYLAVKKARSGHLF